MEVRHMRISYDKLWRLLAKNKMKRYDLAAAAGVSTYTMGKMYKDEPVSLEAIMKICQVFHCDIGDVVEMVEDN